MDQDQKDQPQTTNTPPPAAPTPATPAIPPPAPSSASGHVDLGKVLLPKKEGTPSLDSAQRINAGALFAQEEKAATEGTNTPPRPTPAPPPKPQEEVGEVRPIETYKGDVESVIQGKNISVVSIAAAEAERRGKAGIAQQTTDAQANEAGMGLVTKILMVLGGIILISAAVGVGVFVYLRPTTVDIPKEPDAPFVSVDNTAIVSAPVDQFTRDALMTNLEAARTSVRISLGLVSRLFVAVPATTTDAAPQEVDARTLVSLLAPTLSPGFVRSIQPAYLLGLHSFDENQAFLILKVDSYESAFAGMIAWEYTMQKDLAPLFTRTPTPHIPEGGVGTSSPQVQLIPTGFSDRIVENHDARVIENETKDILLLWTFLDRNTVIITTNEYTLREIISRLSNTSVIPQPGQ